MLQLEEYKKQAKLCVRCSFCKYIDMNYVASLQFSRQCPIDSKYGFNLYSAQGLLYSALSESEGKLEFSPKLIDALYHCTVCGGCDARCKRNLDIEVLQVIETLRSRYVESGHTLPKGLNAIVNNVRKTKNIYGKPQRNRKDWQRDGLKSEKDANVLYFVGDAMAFQQPELAAATANIFQKAGVKFAMLEDEWADGNYIMSAGQNDLAKELAEHNVASIKDTGIKMVITSDAEAYKSLKVDYPRLLGKSTTDMPYTVMHISEYFDNLVKEGKLQFADKVPLEATYHDACNLGRLSEPWVEWEPKYDGPIPVGKAWRRSDRGVYDPPRNVLKKIHGLELVEMERRRSNAWCAGNCGGVLFSFPEFALWAAEQLIDEAMATGAEAIITCSADEKELLLKAMKSKKAGMKVCHFVEIMLQAM
jgi:dimethylglycine catabolism B